MTSPCVTRFNSTGLVHVSEHRGWWLKGRVLTGANPSFEICFEHWSEMPDQLFILPTIKATYAGIFHRNRTIGEFHFGRWFIPPRTDEDKHYFDVLFTACIDYSPQFYQEPPDFNQWLALAGIRTGTGGTHI